MTLEVWQSIYEPHEFLEEAKGQHMQALKCSRQRRVLTDPGGMLSSRVATASSLASSTSSMPYMH